MVLSAESRRREQGTDRMPSKGLNEEDGAVSQREYEMQVLKHEDEVMKS